MKLLFGILTTWAMVLTLRQSCVFGELAILRDAPSASETNSNIFTRRLTCVSGDDSSALVWNLDYTDNENPTTLQKFVDSHTEPIGIECPLNETGGCMSEWTTNHWSITNSFEKPMGPVMDKRWEDFEDIVFMRDRHDEKIIKVQDSGAIIFSVRGTITVKILLSHSFDDGSPCYMIVIDGRKGEASFICEHVWQNDGQQTPGPKCLKTKSSEKHEESLLSPMEWRTFILKWSEENKAVTVYDRKKRIISQTFTEWQNINWVSFFRGSYTTRYRFHKYNYLHTTKNNSYLLSPRIDVKDPTLCFEMLIGLCAACEARINIKAYHGSDPTSYALGTVRSERHSNGDGLPMWKHVRFNQSYNKSHGNYVKLRIGAHLSGNDPNPLWALANFRMCKGKDTVRRSSMKIKQVLNEKNEKLWPKVNCQKLSYGGGSVVSSDSVIQPELKHGMPLCERRRVGPNCAIYCSLISADASCRNLAICIDKGCVCAQGWEGRNCDIGCKNKFGYNCELPCGRCEDTKCDAGSGTCPATCDGDFIPPYCEELEIPDVVSVNETSAVVALHVKRYDKRLNYTLWVQQEGSKTGNFVKKDIESWKNTSTLEYVIDDLKPGTVYVVSGVQFHPGTNSRLKGPGRDFTTHCNHLTSSTEYSLTINREDRISITSMRTTIGAKNETESEAPEYLTTKMLEKGVVILQWPHPWKTNREIDKFIIKIEILSSDLQRNLSQYKYPLENHTVTEYKVNHTKALYLQPSTMYKFTVFVNTVNKDGKLVCKNASTPPALDFENRLELANNQTNHTILVELPSISNNTIDSVMHIIVKGGVPCEERNTLRDTLKCFITLSESENAWIAASLKAEEMKERNFTIGDNRTYKGILNCPLKLGETYDIVVIVEGGMKPTENMTIVSNFLRVKLPGGSTKPGLEYLFFIPIIAALVLLTCCVYRKCNRRSKRNGSQNIRTLYQRGVSLRDLNAEILEMRETSPPSSRMTGSYNVHEPEVAYAAKSVSSEYEYICLMRIKDFEEYVKNSVDSGEFRNQFTKFPRGKQKPWDCGMLPPNRKKNRDENLMAYDETRVVLEKLPRDHHSDYINANYINGYNRERAYIATQGPMSKTVLDFWRMIWQEDVQVICMMTTIGKTKCEQYWPEVRMTEKYGKITVRTIGQMVFADFTHRTLQVTCSGRTREINHLQYTAWPERGVPTYFHSLVLYLRKLLALHPGDGPVVVHCSTGAGTTGIIILCDICLRRAADTGYLDVVAETKDILRQRANMMNDYQEYLLVHLLIAECLQSQQTTLPCDAALSTNICRMRQNLRDQLERLNESAWQDTILLQDAQRPQLLRTGEMSAHPDIVPVADHYDYIDENHIDQDNSIYMSADYVDGVQLKNQYVTRSLPSTSTFSNFWETMAEQKVELILILQQPDPENLVYCDVVKGSEFNPSFTLKVTVRSETDGEFPTQKLRLIDTSRGTERIQPVTILRCKGWTVKMGSKPPSAETLVRLWQTCEKISRGGPAVVVCPDGLTGCGLYLALSFLLERMSVEQECDVCFAIRTVRRSKLQFMPTLEQFNTLYDAAEKYCECFETYANFK